MHIIPINVTIKSNIRYQVIYVSDNIMIVLSQDWDITLTGKYLLFLIYYSTFLKLDFP